MCNCIKSVATSDVFCSVISGVLVFCISQIILEIIIKPKIAYRNLKNRISTACIYYADVITNPFLVEQEKTKEQFDWFQNSKYNEASNELRQLASEIGAYSLKKKEAKEIGDLLMLLSNTMWYYSNSSHDGSDNWENLERLKQFLQRKHRKQQDKNKTR
ncbi:MAG: hypothetical protein IKD47_01105 [Clostridia bacterium]|nr:hypothetical protein [Clostridia bacterium]